MSEEYIIGLIVASIGAIWVYLKTTYFPHRQEMEKLKLSHQLEIEKKREEAAEKQRQHEQMLAERKAEEDKAQREFDREMIKLKTQTETSEEGSIWQQMVGLQTSLMGQGKDSTEFIIGLATDRYDQQQQESRQTLRELSELNRQATAEANNKWAEIIKDNTAKWNVAQNEYRNLISQMSILVNETVRREEDREVVKRVPELVSQLLIQQSHYQERLLKICERLDARFPNDLQS